MKVNKLLFCLLFLMLGTTTAWADKYYQPGSYKGDNTPRLTLEQAVGKKFMIYNTAIAGNVDRTGFLRNGGASFEHDKSKERDLYVYNESFVYTMEKHTDDDGTVWYAIKSVNTGLYVNAAGKTDILKATDAKLIITSWNEATEGKSGVNMESWKYSVIANNKITSDGHGSTVFVVKNGNTYWNGNPDAFATYSNGHPFAFYEAHEVTGGEYLQDLHIYSRSDIYSAQVIYGYIKDASQITSSPRFVDEGGFENLIDGDATTYNVTDWKSTTNGHYYQIDLRTSVESLYLYMQRRADGKNAPTKYELQASADGNSYKKIGEYTTELASKVFYTSPKILLNGSYQHLRIVARETTTPDYKCMGFSELYVLPGTPEMEDVLKFVNLSAADPIYTKTTAKEYTRLVEKYNSECPDAKLLSGVPLPGNKYRIYADAYDVKNHVYVNREIKADSEFDDLEIVSPGSYHKTEGDARKMYEWYCERTADGYLVFRNVANPKKYLGNGAVVDEPYGWSMSTLGTQRHGVPLRNHAQQYLAVYNDGTHWMGNVKEIQNQTVANASIDHDNNAETDPKIVEKGLCTDFVFIPVPNSDNEKKITITANDLVERNTRLLFDSNGDGTAEVHPLPFSRMFVDPNKFSKLQLQLLCNDVHVYKGVKVNGVLNDAVATHNVNDNVISFNFNAVNDGDILEIQLDIKKPFEVMSAEFKTTETPHLYLIRNKHQLGLPQQARPNRADVNIEIGGDENDQPISSQTGRRYYARFNNRGADMDLVEGTETWQNTDIDANSLFYFTETEDKDHAEYYCVDIHNATTVMKCADHAKWDNQGNTWFVQPKKITNNYGYNIGRTILNTNNNPNDVWGCSHSEGNKIVMHSANDDGTAWEFIPVDDPTAKKLLYEFIDGVAKELYSAIDSKMDLPGIDETKAGYYLKMVEMMHDRAAYFKDPESYKISGGSFSDETSNPVAKLLQFAQNIHMLEHEIEYALYELPGLSQDVVGKLSDLGNSEQPHWYYIRNVKSNNYAGYVDTDAQMSLGQFPVDEEGENQPQLKNLFYFVGEKNSYAPVMDDDPNNNGLYHDFPGNNLIVDEYLKAHMHTFMAKDLTLVSKNVKVPMSNVNMNPGSGKQTVANVSLKHDEDWRVELEYDLTGHTQYNAYGSALLASTGDPLADNYTGAFQVYFKDDHSIVIKCNNADDGYRFWHTQNYCSHIKVVITYSQHVVTMDVYNSIGVKETKHVYGVTLNDISQLTTALPADGVTLTKLNAYQVEEMTWKTHQQLQEDGENKDDWYILPSSNTAYPGLAIVLEDPNDNMMGWAKGEEGEGKYITTDLGTADNSTWKFERVIEFDAHVDELLEMYDYKDCVIYDKDIARLYALILEKSTFIKEHENDPLEEAAFNELYYAFLNYKGRTAAELQAPKPGSLYTIRPMVEENTGNALLVHVDKSNETYSTKEVYNGGVVRAGEDEKSYDPRGVWVFEGTAGADGFLPLKDLKLRNLHTQCYLTALGDAASAVNEADAAQVTLGTIGGCITKFQVGEKFMNRTTVSPTLSYDRTRDFWGDALINYPSALDESINTGKTEGNIPSTEGNVRCKRLDVEVKTDVNETSKNVVVTFTYEGGDHKINILGVELLGNNGKMLYADYHYGSADSDQENSVYTINGVVAGAYTMNCYVFEPDGGDQLTEHKGHFEIDGVVAYSGEGKIINTDIETTKWIVEEILNPEESVYYETSTNTNGHSTLMLGFPTLIPDEVEAFHGVTDGKILDGRYISMVSYGEPYETRILPANAPVILRNTDQSIESKTVKFYYRESNAKAVADNYIFGHLYFTAVKCASFDDVDGDGNPDRDIDIYMLNKNKTTTRMYRTYENYDKDGNKVTLSDGTTTHFEGGYVTCKANKAFMVLSKETSQSVSSLAFTFTTGGTTSVDDVETELGELEIIETIYDLQGRRLSEITQPGIYIVNGKKVFVK